MSGGEEELQQQQQDKASPSPSSMMSSSGPGASISASTSSSAGGRATPEMKRSAVRSLIQRYFHQLQSGCGNANCSNINCASSGRVPTMTPNEVAARALQLFSQDAQLCERPTSTSNNTSITTTTATLNESASGSGVDVDMLSPNESSSSGSSSSSSSSSSNSSSSSTSTITSASSTNTTGTQLCRTVLLPTTTTTTTSSSSTTAPPMSPLELRPKVSPESTTTPTRAQQQQQPTPDTIDADTLEALIEQSRVTNNNEHLVRIISDIFSRVWRLSGSFCCPRTITTAVKTTNSQKMVALALNKEEMRTLEGEHDKDEDSTQQDTQADTQAAALDDDAAADDEEEEAEATDSDATPHEDEPMEQQSSTPTSSNGGCTGGGGGAGVGGGVGELEPRNCSTLVDFIGLRRIKRLLFDAGPDRQPFDTPCNPLAEVLITSVMQLADRIRYKYSHDWEQVLHCLVICFDLATNSNNQPSDMEYQDRVLPKLCHATAKLPLKAQARLASIWATHCADQLKPLLAACQQQITLQVLRDEESVRENENIISATKVLKIVFYANLLASEIAYPCNLLTADGGDNDTQLNAATTSSSLTGGGSGDSGAGAAAAATAAALSAADDDLFLYSTLQQPHMPKFAEDQLEKLLQISCINCRKPIVQLEEFYNEALSDNIQMHHDYLSYKSLAMESDLGSSINSGHHQHQQQNNYFSFMLYAFILTPATKVDALYYDSRMRMYSERYSSLYSILNQFGDGQDGSPRPDLKLTVRRDQLINDALIGLELVAMSNPKDLKKQLVVEFVGEQGIDEGGVSKEFFQLIVEEIFNPAFGMFVHQEETNTMWFNATPFENGAQYTLIGIIIGLAIYNNVILAVNFPMVVYRKLLGYRGTFYDLSDWSPTLYTSLKSMLDYENEDMDEVFGQTFKISHSNVFGELVEHELVPHGSAVLVGQHNKQLFVNLYSDYLLNVSIEQQFNAFRKGFEMVTDESPLKLLFRPEEIEMLVCGSRKFDFVELEQSTEYEGGYSEETQIIQDFWSIVHAMPHESKRKLLEFTTGSDRVPVGGLKCLRLLITRHGPDSERLPTSHTCFNVLLLPEYSSKEKLEERLLKAINYSKGFGML